MIAYTCPYGHILLLSLISTMVGITPKSSTAGETNFIAPGNNTMEAHIVTFTFADMPTLEIIFHDDFGVFIADTSTGAEYQVGYYSGKFGGLTDAKDGEFQIGAVVYVDGGLPKWELDLIWSSETEATFTGKYIPNVWAPATFTAVSGTARLTPPLIVNRNNLTYAINNGEAMITKCAPSATGSLVIPDVIESIPVTKITHKAFDECINLNSVTIPNSIIDIHADAFRSCSNLTSVTISNSVTLIRRGVFSYCSELIDVTLPDNLIQIDSTSFISCSSLTSIDIPESVNSIGYGAFAHCSSLNSIVIPENVTKIESSTFLNCSSLTEVSMLGVRLIHYDAFQNCSSLTTITFPSSVLGITDNAFSGCSKLTSVIFDGDAPTNLSSSAFFDVAPTFKVYFYESATAFTSPTWEGHASEQLQLDDDNDGDRFPNGLERLLGTSPLDGNSRFQVRLSHNNAGMQIHYSPHSDACEFIVESTTDLTAPDSWQSDESLTFSTELNEAVADCPENEGEAVFYRMQVSARE
jgi:hypothetical protein